MFVVIRHGHAGSRSDWPGDDASRPLSARGHRQALALAAALAPLDPGHLLSSPAARCQQTLEPLGARLGLAVEDHPLLAADADPVALSHLLAALAGRRVVVSTHGETIRGLLDLWGDVATVGGPEDRHTAKGAAWIVHGFPAGRPVLHYLPAQATSPLARPA